MEQEIEKLINDFDNKIDKYYRNSIFGNDILRMFNGTNIYLREFYDIYSKSKFFKDETEEDKKINFKILNSLIDIILLNIMINEVDRLDNIGVNIYEPKNEFEVIYNISKDLNLVNKTRILWERIMNFSYLIITREDLEKKVSSKSKKATFKTWYESKGYMFFESYNNFINVFDKKYRTPETHKSSTLRKLFFNDASSPILGISLYMAMSFGQTIYPNILGILKGEKFMILSWTKIRSIDGKSVPKEFNEIPNIIRERATALGEDIDKLDNFTCIVEAEYND